MPDWSIKIKGKPAVFTPDIDNVKPGTKPLIWWDVFPIPSGIKATDAQGNPINGPDGKQIGVPGHFRMRSRFVDFAGQYVLHCHILAHEDRGMMAIVQVSAGKPMPSYMHH
jgi:FtsP/CotA-like multicopper oxidase with cupredoxin domain